MAHGNRSQSHIFPIASAICESRPFTSFFFVYSGLTYERVEFATMLTLETPISFGLYPLHVTCRNQSLVL